MPSSYKRLGDYIQEVNIRNRDLSNIPLLGVSIKKVLMPSIANIIGTDMSTYKLIEKNQFAYGPVTSRNGDKISIALLEEYDNAMVSQAYTVFEVVDESELLPEYLMMWFRRPEYDRYARFMSHGSAREIFSWTEMCETELPIPSIEKQREIVREYNIIQNRIALNNRLISKLEETAQAIYKQWFLEFEFPDENGLPYKSNGGKMVWCEELEKEVPEGWEIKPLSDLSLLITKGTTPQKFYTDFSSELIPYVKIQAISKNNFVNPFKLEYIDLETHNELRRSQIFEDDILFSITGTLGEFVKATKNVTPANTNQNIAIIRIDKNIIPVNFIYWLLMCGWHLEFQLENTQEAVQANLNLAMIGNIRMLMPSESFINCIQKQIDIIIDSLYNSHLEIQLLTEISDLALSKMTKV